MKSEELLKAIGKIDDELIDEKAQKKQDIKILPDSTSRVKSFRWKPILKTAAVCACAFALVLGITIPNLRMGASKSASYDMVAAPEAEMPEAYSYAAVDDYDLPREVNGGAMKMKTTVEEASGIFEPATLPSKLVYRANFSIETEDYDKTLEEIKAEVEKVDGYFENSESYNGSYYYDNSNKSGWFTVRVPQGNYQSFITALTENYHITSQSENIDNITESYYDTQDRLDTLRIKEERLHELLSKATNMSDIIEIENSLTDTESQINNLTRVMKGYDNQVDYASITIDLCQVRQMGSTVTSEGFADRIARALKNGFTNFAEGIADFFVFISYNVIEIVLIIAAVIIIWRFKLIRKLINWIKK